KLPRLHPAKEIEILFRGAIAVRRFLPRLGQRAAIFAHLLGAEAVDVRLAVRDEVLGPFIELVEVVGRVAMLLPREAEPAYILFDRVDVLDVFLRRVRVVIAEIAPAAELAEIETDRFRMADVQIAVRLRREPRDHGLIAAGAEVFIDDLTNEIARFGRALGAHGWGKIHQGRQQETAPAPNAARRLTAAA